MTVPLGDVKQMLREKFRSTCKGGEIPAEWQEIMFSVIDEIRTYEDVFHIGWKSDAVAILMGAVAVHGLPQFKEGIVTILQGSLVNITNILQDIEAREQKEMKRDRKI